MSIGYSRVNTQDQNLDLQMDALDKVGCEAIFKDQIFGKSWERPELVKLFDKLRKDDTGVVWKLDIPGNSRMINGKTLKLALPW